MQSRNLRVAFRLKPSRAEKSVLISEDRWLWNEIKFMNVKITQSVVSCFSRQKKLSLIFEISCHDLANYSWQGTQDFARFLRSWKKIKKIVVLLAKKIKNTQNLGKKWKNPRKTKTPSKFKYTKIERNSTPLLEIWYLWPRLLHAIIIFWGLPLRRTFYPR